LPEPALIAIKDLDVRYRVGRAEARALSSVSFSLDRNRVLGLVGESGSGKSTVGRTIMGLLARNGRVAGGRIDLNGEDLLRKSKSELRAIRWAQVAMVFQTAMSALNPVIKIGVQVVECMTTHGVARDSANSRAVDLMKSVGLPEGVLGRYPHQLSGGMRQRVAIAMAWSLDPPLIIADEPTTALDVITQKEVLDNLLVSGRARGQSVILITHDMAVVAERTDVVVVLYGGSVMERGSVRDIFLRPSHPYTIGLIGTVPDARRAKAALLSIPGAPPSLTEHGTGCPFNPRCPFAEGRCRIETPATHEIAQEHVVACHFPERAVDFRRRALSREIWEPSMRRQ
jgi:oligopeptide/dipeptide ABC transporter ATP-binding protein